MKLFLNRPIYLSSERELGRNLFYGAGQDVVALLSQKRQKRSLGQKSSQKYSKPKYQMVLYFS